MTNKEWWCCPDCREERPYRIFIWEAEALAHAQVTGHKPYRCESAERFQ